MSDSVLLAVPKGTFTDEEIRSVGWKKLYEDDSQSVFQASISEAPAPPQLWDCSYRSEPPSQLRGAGAYNVETIKATVPAAPQPAYVAAYVTVSPEVFEEPGGLTSKVRLNIKRLSVSLTPSSPATASAGASSDFLDNWSIAIVPEWEGEKHLLAIGPVKEADKVNRTRQDQRAGTIGFGVDAAPNPKLTFTGNYTKGGTDIYNIGAVDSESFTCATHDQDATFSWVLRQWVQQGVGRAVPCERKKLPLVVPDDIATLVKPIFEEYTSIIVPPPFMTEQLTKKVHKLAGDAGDPGFAEWAKVPTDRINSGEVKWCVYAFVCANSWVPLDSTAMSCLPGAQALLRKLRNQPAYQSCPRPLGPVHLGDIRPRAAG